MSALCFTNISETYPDTGIRVLSSKDPPIHGNLDKYLTYLCQTHMHIQYSNSSRKTSNILPYVQDQHIGSPLEMVPANSMNAIVKKDMGRCRNTLITESAKFNFGFTMNKSIFMLNPFP